MKHRNDGVHHDGLIIDELSNNVTELICFTLFFTFFVFYIVDTPSFVTGYYLVLTLNYYLNLKFYFCSLYFSYMKLLGTWKLVLQYVLRTIPSVRIPTQNSSIKSS